MEDIHTRYYRVIAQTQRHMRPQEQEQEQEKEQELKAESECSICLKDIAKETGVSTMACGHSFHIGCLARWLFKNESCPYCRHSANEQERIEEDQGTENEEEDDYDTVEEFYVLGGGISNMRIPRFNEESHALWVFRRTMEMIEKGEELTGEKNILPPSTRVPSPGIDNGYFSE